MKPLHRSIAGLVLVLAAAASTGCDAQKPAAQSPVVASHEAISRSDAIQNAQRDAAFRYAEVSVVRVDARRLGAYWVVELAAANGSGLRYTISAHDGSIRERNTFQ
ncbi:MAG: hypothetical protein U0441_38685 [Polyangiaceae bacterium]